MRRVISDIINSDDEYEVEAIAKDGLEGYEMISAKPNHYSAVILDINMPKMNGLELLEKLQKNRIEQNVIVVSTVAKEGAKETIRALELGAFDFVTKPENYLETKGEAFHNKIKQMLDVATASSNVPVQPTPRQTAVTSTRSEKGSLTRRTSAETDSGSSMEFRRKSQQIDSVATRVEATKFTGVKRGMNKLVALACSTGGPKTLQKVVPLLPKNLDAPMVIVQHMPAGFTASLAMRLNEMSALNVVEAKDGDVLQKGKVYIAPGGRHMRVVKTSAGHEIRISDEAPVEGLRPCANVMFQSLGRCSFDEVTCVVLTGMGADGTKGISELAAQKKKMHVIAQDESTCVVYGMPKAIAMTGLVDDVVPVGQVAEMITKNVGVS
jgi:two-component system chemotaxis response regulator CheB